MGTPTPFTVQREVRSDGPANTHNVISDVYAAPGDVPVCGWAPPGPDVEPASSGRAEVVRDLDLYAPAGTRSAPRDRWTVDGIAYFAVGWPEDFTHGPWQWSAGVRINLKRIEG